MVSATLVVLKVRDAGAVPYVEFTVSQIGRVMVFTVK
jgi:hypothetical protein